jgi:hypothetical protein
MALEGELCSWVAAADFWGVSKFGFLATSSSLMCLLITLKPVSSSINFFQIKRAQLTLVEFDLPRWHLSLVEVLDLLLLGTGDGCSLVEIVFEANFASGDWCSLRPSLQ